MPFSRNYVNDVRSAIEAYKTSIHAILSNYQDGMSKAKSESVKFKEPAAFIKERKDALVSASRTQIEAEDSNLQSKVIKALQALRTEALRDAAKPAPRDVMDALKDAKTFGLKLSPAELGAFARRIKGNYTANKALRVVALQSGFDMAVPSFDELEQTIAKISNAVKPPLLYCDNGDLRSALDVLGDKYQRNHDNDPLFKIGPVSAASLALTRAQFNGLADMLTPLEAWDRQHIPDISEFTPIVTDEDDKITPAQQQKEAIDKMAEELAETVTPTTKESDNAAEIAAKTAENERFAKSVINQYVMGGSN